MKCRLCGKSLDLLFLDLGNAPPSNAYLSPNQLYAPEITYPLRLLVCESCRLVQTEDYAGREDLFSNDYAYFSSYSSTWVAHAEAYVQKMRARLKLDDQSMVVEIAANDGYLLQFVKNARIPCYGVEPTAGTAAAARARGLDIVERFFGSELAAELVGKKRQADLIVANNVLAHVPDISDFVAGFSLLLKPQGTVTFEFPYLIRMVEENQFDTAYHEHYSYLSLTAIYPLFLEKGLEIFDIEELTTHGGSLRLFVQLKSTGKQPTSPIVNTFLEQEISKGIQTNEFYQSFQVKAEKVKNDFICFLIETKRSGKRIAAYGAAAKGNTLLNFAGVRPDLLPYVVDKNPSKQGKYMPGSHIPIVNEGKLEETHPDYIVILPWNLKAEIIHQLSYVREWGAKFVTAVPKLEVIG